MRQLSFGVIAILAGVAPAIAAEPWIGRWAEEAKFCTRPGSSGNETPMTFTHTTARWFGTCNIRSIRRQGGSWVLKAKCPRNGATLQIWLSREGEKLRAAWGEAHPQVMVRCP